MQSSTWSFIRKNLLSLAFLCCVSSSTATHAADLSDAYALFYQGDYSACAEMCKEEVQRGVWNDGWSRLLIESHFALGQYEEAKEVYDSVQLKFNSSLTLRILGIEAYRYCNDSAAARKLLEEIPEMVENASYRYTDRENRLALGRLAVSMGNDAREVLKSSYDVVLRSDPKFVDAHIAVGELGLEKADYQEAAKSFAKAVELRPADPQIHYLLARAWESSDPVKCDAFLSKALELNPRHTDSLLMQARNRIDAERYDQAEQILQTIQETNPRHPIAIALQASIAHLRGAYEEEGKLRKKALATWELNPRVDFTIGDVLSRHYRFVEGAEYQRRAFQMDPQFAPARFRLAQDLLRLGKDEEGWELVRQVAESDRYNVEAFNLRTLQDRLSQFTTIEGNNLWLRMDAKEAQIYGQRALKLLEEAKDVLEKRYDFPLKHRVTVEIFPKQSDFAIRTFGLPGGVGFLGVCFGNVITANSPASQGETPSNWESVLWHEFCHSITLQKTNNRMPRWLSEGISVYEELQRNPGWGQRMNPTYREMLLGEDFVPLSQLSGAFLNPKTPMHLQFAYFESSLAVQYLVEVHGLPLLQRLLVDLGTGVPMQMALENRYGATEGLDKDFKAYIQKIATGFHPNTDFAKSPKPDAKRDSEGVGGELGIDGGLFGEGGRKSLTEAELTEWLKEKPNSYYALRQQVISQIASKNWNSATTSATRLLELYPDDSERGGALDLAALVARESKDSATEAKHLMTLTRLSGDRVSALQRLIELNREAQDWASMVDNANRLLAVQPLTSVGHEALVEANAKLGRLADSVDSLVALRELKPTDPAGVHYQLAEALHAAGRDTEARIEVLKALEFSPRYREAQKLLLAIRKQLDAASSTPTTNE